jgi:hypothetical protein
MIKLYPFLVRVFDKKTGVEMSAKETMTPQEAVEAFEVMAEVYAESEYQRRILVWPVATPQELQELKDLLAARDTSLEAVDFP